ncbi:hypothetical protein F7725_009134 [Dissostichus mawsoni]|uniref:aromatase n=1 Tax=Dissostichus mawsoni TaxID=36200 RepID=A0A7J5Z698_DISMA|nr:hypothetical protein F7725_009134 [Dissostichus mawsoni]
MNQNDGMSLFRGVLSQVLSWTGLWQLMVLVGAGLGAVVSVWTVKLLVRHAWFTHRLSCFSKPHAHSWLLGHLGKMQSTEEGLLQVDDLVQMYTHSCSWFIGPFYHLVRLFHPDYDKWHKLLAEGTNHVEMFDHVTLMTLDSLLKCAFSYNSNCQRFSSEYVSAIVELSDLIIDRRTKILHHWDFIYWKTQQGKQFKKALSIVHRFTMEVVQKRRALISQQKKTGAHFTAVPQKKKDFVDIILLSKDEHGRGLTDEEIQAEANTFMFAGHDTTASAISWTLYNLARHEDHQENCRQEVTDLMQGRETHAIQWEDLANLPFITMCIRESLRLHSPVQAVTRKYTKDMDLPGDRTVPKGAISLVSIYGTHHNPAVWTNPHEFDPLRFEPANTEGRSSHAFIPFSSGPRYCVLNAARNCIGQKFAMAELRVVLALTLLKFRLTPGSDPEMGSSSGGVRRLPQLVLRAEGGLWLQLETINMEELQDE